MAVAEFSIPERALFETSFRKKDGLADGLGV
jgi:hypothetical protein